jgi:dolichyl-phosphate-mannose--protein O-mannosyl transferase
MWALVATGVSLGCALQCKYAMALTTLGWLGLQNVHTLSHYVFQRRGSRTLLWQMVVRGGLLLGLPVALHLLLLSVHLAHLPRTGNGDGYMSPLFQSTLLGNPHQRAALAAGRPPPGLVALALEHLRTQFWYNRNMAILFPRGSHPFDTAWYTWPLAWRGVYFNLVKHWSTLAQHVSEPHVYGIFIHPSPHTTLATTAIAAAASLGLAWRLACVLRPWPCGAARDDAAARLVHTLRPGGVGSLVVAYLMHWLPYATQVSLVNCLLSASDCLGASYSLAPVSHTVP